MSYLQQDNLLREQLQSLLSHLVEPALNVQLRMFSFLVLQLHCDIFIAAQICCKVDLPE